MWISRNTTHPQSTNLIHIDNCEFVYSVHAGFLNDVMFEITITLLNIQKSCATQNYSNGFSSDLSTETHTV